jgi:hypothetical protein
VSSTLKSIHEAAFAIVLQLAASEYSVFVAIEYIGVPLGTLLSVASCRTRNCVPKRLDQHKWQLVVIRRDLALEQLQSVMCGAWRSVHNSCAIILQ